MSTESANDEVAELYDILARLNAEREKRPDDVELQRRIRTMFERLRAVQTEQAAVRRRRFERSLKMPLGAGAQALAEARSLRARYDRS